MRSVLINLYLVLRDQVELEKLFFSYVPERVGPGRWLPFVHAWAEMQDVPQTFNSIAMRALVCVYFVLLVGLARILVQLGVLKTATGDKYGDLCYGTISRFLYVRSQLIQLTIILQETASGFGNYSRVGTTDSRAIPIWAGAGPAHWTLSSSARWTAWRAG